MKFEPLTSEQREALEAFDREMRDVVIPEIVRRLKERAQIAAKAR